MVTIGVLFEVLLRMEFFKRRLKFPYNPTNFSPLETKKELSEIICDALIFSGLAIELIALPFALFDEHKKIVEINRQIAAQNPLNQPIYAFEATATILVKPSEPTTDLQTLPKIYFSGNSWSFPPDKSEKENRLIMLYLGTKKELENGDFGYTQIASDDSRKCVAVPFGGKDEFLRFDLHFGGIQEHFFENKTGGQFNFDNVSLTPLRLEAINIVLPIRCEVIAGELRMQIDNGITNRVFQIPKQKSFVCAVTSFETNGIFLPIDFSPAVRKLHDGK